MNNQYIPTLLAFLTCANKKKTCRGFERAMREYVYAFEEKFFASFNRQV